MTRTRLFQSNRTQAVRLPREVAFPAGVTEVVVVRDGTGRRILPADAAWDDVFDGPGIDLPEREQPLPQSRDSLARDALARDALAGDDPTRDGP